MLQRIFTRRFGGRYLPVVLLTALMGCTTDTGPGPAPTPVAPAITATAIPTAHPTSLPSPTNPVPGSATPAAPANGLWQPPEPQKAPPLSPADDLATNLITWSEEVSVLGNLFMKITRDGQLFIIEPQQTRQYQITPAAFAELQAQITASDFPSLQTKYKDSTTADSRRIILIYSGEGPPKAVGITGTAAVPPPLQRLVATLRDLKEHPDAQATLIRPAVPWLAYKLHGERADYTLEIDGDYGLRYWVGGIAAPRAYLSTQDQATLRRLLDKLQSLGAAQQYREFGDEQRSPLLNRMVTVTVHQNEQPVQMLEASSGAQVPAAFQALLDWLALIYDDYAGTTP